MPNGFATTSAGFRLFLQRNGLDSKIDEKLSKIDSNRTTEARSAITTGYRPAVSSRRIRCCAALISRLALPIRELVLLLPSSSSSSYSARHFLQALHEAGHAIRGWILDAELPQELVAEVVAAYEELIADAGAHS